MGFGVFSEKDDTAHLFVQPMYHEKFALKILVKDIEQAYFSPVAFWDCRQFLGFVDGDQIFVFKEDGDGVKIMFDGMEHFKSSIFLIRTMVVEGCPNPGINHLRIGTAILLGFSSSLNPVVISGYEHDTFVLQAEVIEVKAGNPVEEILAIGKIDTDHQFLFLIQRDVRVREASSDHLMVRVDPPARVGDRVSFRLGYPALCRVMASSYLKSSMWEKRFRSMRQYLAEK